MYSRWQNCKHWIPWLVRDNSSVTSLLGWSSSCQLLEICFLCISNACGKPTQFSKMTGSVSLLEMERNHQEEINPLEIMSEKKEDQKHWPQIASEGAKV